MKKLVMTVAVLACAVSFVSAQVTSANIVGYSKGSVAAGSFEVVAAQFLVGSVADGMTLDDAFGDNVGNGDQVLFWSGAGYSVYTYYTGWGWYDYTGTVESGDVIIPSGTSVWMKSVAGTEYIVAGEVPSSDSVTITLVAGFNMITSPYPVAMALDDLSTDVLSNGDQALFWNGAGYTVYTYYTGWGWYDYTGTVESGDVTIPVGGGCWLKSAAGGDLVVTKPF